MRRNVIVNGDDMLFRCPRSFYTCFKAVAQLVGFKLSAGKNYLSPRAAMINSQLFIESCRSDGPEVRRVGYLNQRILSGRAVKKGEEDTQTAFGMAKSVNDMLDLLPSGRCLIPYIMSRLGTKFREFRANWYLPVHLGGIGVSPRFAPGGMVNLTIEQRRMAALFVNRPDLQLMVMEGISLPVAMLKGLFPTGLVRYGPYVRRPDEVEEDGWLARIAQYHRWSIHRLIPRIKNVGRDGKVTEPSPDVKPWIRTQRVTVPRRQWRLRPMGPDSILEHWHAQIVTTSIGSPPPPGDLTGLVKRTLARFTHLSYKECESETFAMMHPQDLSEGTTHSVPYFSGLVPDERPEPEDDPRLYIFRNGYGEMPESQYAYMIRQYDRECRAPPSLRLETKSLPAGSTREEYEMAQDVHRRSLRRQLAKARRHYGRLAERVLEQGHHVVFPPTPEETRREVEEEDLDHLAGMEQRALDDERFIAASRRGEAWTQYNEEDGVFGHDLTDPLAEYEAFRRE
jgi:hypothetical protein